MLKSIGFSFIKLMYNPYTGTYREYFTQTLLNNVKQITINKKSLQKPIPKHRFKHLTYTVPFW